MEFNDLIENEDGSCTVKVDLTAEETRQLIEYALVTLLRKHVQSEEYMEEGVEK